MATFEIIEGKPGQGKSLYTARLALRLVKRNKKWYDTTGELRKVASNIKFSQKFEDYAGDFIQYWSTTFELLKLKDVDIIWDEVATELDSRNFATLSEEFRRFLSQYRKRGVDIYANTQDFSMIDLRARMFVTRVATLTKLIGSSDPSPTKPPVKTIWGIIVVREVIDYRSDDPHNKKYALLPSFFFITKEDIELYDTRQDIPQSPPIPLRHVVRHCEFYGVEGHKCENHSKIEHR